MPKSNNFVKHSKMVINYQAISIKKTIAFFILLFIISTFLLMSCSSHSDRTNAAEYVDSLLTERNKKNIELSDTTISRFNEEEIAHFTEKSLQYFAPDINYFVDAKIIVDTSHPTFQMPTTTDRKPNYRIYGFLDFTLKDTVCKLIAYQNMDYKDHPEYGGTVIHTIL